MVSKAVNLDLSSHQDGEHHRDEICRSIQARMVEGWLIPDPGLRPGMVRRSIALQFQSLLGWRGDRLHCVFPDKNRSVLPFVLAYFPGWGAA